MVKKPKAPSTQTKADASEVWGGLNYLFLDIETLPHWDVTRFKQTDKRLKDPEKIKDNIEKAWLKTSLEPEYGCVVTVGTAMNDDEPTCIWYPDQKPDDNIIRSAHYNEQAILEDLEARILEANKLVTWAGKFFDLPFLIKRYIKYKMYDAAKAVKSFMAADHIDMKDVWQFRSWRDDVKLHDAAQCVGADIYPDIDGEDVYRAYCARDLTSIDFHCAQDVRLTRAVFVAAKLGGLI